MADDVAITPGVGASVATDEIGGRNFQRIKVTAGPDGKYVDDFTEVAINCASSGNNVIVAGSGALIIRVYGFWFAVASAVTVKWRSNSTDFHPSISLVNTGSGWDLPRDGRPWFTCVAGEDLVLNLGTAVQTSGRLYYVRD